MAIPYMQQAHDPFLDSKAGFIACPSAYKRDREEVVDTLIAYRVATSVHVYPTAWRLKLLWSSRVWEPGLDTRIWRDERGRMLAFAMLWRRVRMSGYLVLERVVHPAFVSAGLVEDMLGWGLERARRIVARQVEPLLLFARPLAPAVYMEKDLQDYGFIPISHDPQAHNVYFTKSLQGDQPVPELPPGYQIRALDGEQDLENYGALYGFAVVSREHRRDLLASDEYNLLVVEADDKSLLAYCESSFCRAEWRASGKKIGWIDYIETNAEQRGRGLGKAVLLASLGRLRLSGADETLLVTVSNNAAAIQLYQSVGFERTEINEAASYQMVLG